MSRRYLFTSSAGIRHYMIEDEDGTRFQAVAPTDHIVERNKAMATHNDGYTADRSMRRVASIPYIIGLRWLNEEGWWFMDAGHDPDVAKKLAAKLNDPEWRHLRTAEGRIGVTDGMMR